MRYRARCVVLRNKSPRIPAADMYKQVQNRVQFDSADLVERTLLIHYLSIESMCTMLISIIEASVVKAILSILIAVNILFIRSSGCTGLIRGRATRCLADTLIIPF